MPKLKYAVKKLIACWGLLMVLGLPAFPVPEREKMEVGNAFAAAVIPAAANNPGRFGAHYKTRVVIFNPTEGAVSITATLFDHNGPIGQNEIPVEANRFQVNFLGEVFDHSGAGAVSLMAGPDDLFYMTAEVYTDSPNGRFSTTVVNGIVPVFQPGKALIIKTPWNASARCGDFQPDRGCRSPSPRLFSTTTVQSVRMLLNRRRRINSRSRQDDPSGHHRRTVSTANSAVVIHPHADPTGIRRHVVDPIRNRLAQFRIDKVGTTFSEKYSITREPARSR